MFAFRATHPLRLLAASVLTLAVLWAPGGASASCLALPPGQAAWASADAVFVGTVTSVANGARWATVHVEEVWIGPDQPAEVVVRGGPEGNTATSVDRSYTVGMRYVFGVTVVDGQLHDSACSGTTQADAIDLDAMRPDDVRQPVGGTPESAGGGLDLAGIAGPAALIAVVAGLLLATVLLARRREA